MKEELIRTEMLLGRAAIERLQHSHVAVFGIGGVGGYVTEVLARSGVGELTLIDSDRVNRSNINRQIIATHETVGRTKVDAAAERVHAISPDCIVHTLPVKYEDSTRELCFSRHYDYIADCIDLVKCKLDLICTALERNVPHSLSHGHREQSGPLSAAYHRPFENRRLSFGPRHAAGAARPGH